MRLAALAATLLTIAPLGVAADAQPHRHGYERHVVAHRDLPRRRLHKSRVCRTVWDHHRKVRRCVTR